MGKVIEQIRGEAVPVALVVAYREIHREVFGRMPAAEKAREVVRRMRPAMQGTVIGGLTVKQRQVLEAVKYHQATKGTTPTLQQIGEMLGLESVSTVHARLRELEAKGYIRRDWGKTSIEMVEE